MATFVKDCLESVLKGIVGGFLWTGMKAILVGNTWMENIREHGLAGFNFIIAWFFMFQAWGYFKRLSAGSGPSGNRATP